MKFFLKTNYLVGKLFALVGLLAVLWLTTAEVSSKVKIGNLYFNLDEHGKTASVTYEVQESTSNYEGISEMVIPPTVIYDGVTYTVSEIGQWAFNRSPLSSVTLPNTIRTIGKESFAVIQNLKVITIPEGVTSMGDNTFMSSNIEEITLPDSMERLPYGACASMSKLRKITLGKGITSIGGEAFNYSENIKEIVCKGNTPPKFEDGRGSTFMSSVLSEATLYVPKDQVEAYRSSSSWGSFTDILPIEGDGYQIADKNEKIKIGQYYYYLDSDNFTATVTYDLYQSSNNYRGIKGISLPAIVNWGNHDYTVAKVGQSAFDRCYYVEEIYIPESIVEIEKDGFCSNRTVKNIIIGNNVTKIGYGAFAYNYQLEKIVIGNSVKTIGGEAFNYDTNLSTVRVMAQTPPMLEGGRGGCFSSRTYQDAILQVPSGCVSLYRNADGWKNFEHIEEYRDGVVKIGSLNYILDFENKTAEVTYESLIPTENYQTVKEVSIPGTIPHSSNQFEVVSIGDMAFSGSRISKFIIPEGIRSIGSSAFAGLANNIEEITLPGSVEKIGNNAFQGSQIKRLSFGMSSLVVGTSVCSENRALSELELGTVVGQIGVNAFSGCRNIKDIIIRSEVPPMVDYPEGNIFDGNIFEDAILKVPASSIDRYKNDGFWGLFNNIRAIDLPSGRYKIGELYYILDGTTATAEVTYQYYEDDNNYSYLTTITIPEMVNYSGYDYKVVKIGESAFDRAYKLTHADIPNTVTEIGMNGFCSNHSLKSIVLGDNVTALGYGSFAFNYELTSITLGESVSTIGGESFYQSSKLKEIICRAKEPASTATNWFSVFSTTQYNNTILYVPKGSKSKYKTAENWNKFKNILEMDEAEDIEYFSSDIRYLLHPSTMTASVTWEKYNTDDNYQGLENIVIPSVLKYGEEYYKVTSIDDMAFSRSGIKTLILPETINSIGRMSLSYLSNLREIVIPNSVKGMKENVFSNSRSLETVTIGSGITRIEKGTFSDCENLKNIILGESLASIGENVFENDCNIVSIKCLSKTPPAFDNSSSKNFAATVLSVASLSVPEDSRLYYTTAPVWKDFRSIGNSKSVKIGPLYYVLDYDKGTATTTFDVYQSTDNYKGIKDVIIPESIIWGEEFIVTGIGESTFDRCYDISNYDIPYTVTEIGKDAFCSNHSVKKVVIGDNVTRIGYGAFAYNYQMESLVIGENVESIGGEAFGYDYNLMKVVCRSELPPTMENGRYLTFSQNTYENAILYVPQGSVQAYRNSKWNQFANIEEYVDKSESVEGIRFYKDEEAGELSATYECYNKSGNYINLKELILPEYVEMSDTRSSGIRKSTNSPQTYPLTSIGEQAFNYAIIEKLVIPSTVTTIGRVAFANLHWIKQISIPGSVKIIENCAFSSSRSIEYVEIGDGTEEIGYGSFYQNWALHEVNLSSSLLHIGGEAFAYCPNIETVVCKAVTPPTIDEVSRSIFDENVYNEATLYVEDDSVELYKKASDWKKFKNILPLSEFDEFKYSSKVDIITGEDDESSLNYDKIGEDELIECYSSDGKLIFKGKKKNFVSNVGIFIVRYKGKATKIVRL